MVLKARCMRQRFGGKAEFVLATRSEIAFHLAFTRRRRDRLRGSLGLGCFRLTSDVRPLTSALIGAIARKSRRRTELHRTSCKRYRHWFPVFGRCQMTIRWRLARAD